MLAFNRHRRFSCLEQNLLHDIRCAEYVCAGYITYDTILLDTRVATFYVRSCVPDPMWAWKATCGTACLVASPASYVSRRLPRRTSIGHRPAEVRFMVRATSRLKHLHSYLLSNVTLFHMSPPSDPKPKRLLRCRQARLSLPSSSRANPLCRLRNLRTTGKTSMCLSSSP